jgi:N-carbamoyl-L-amino-acid hydrolase
VGALDGGMLRRRDGQGRTLAEAIELMGGRPDEIPGARRDAGSVALYLELHIEQGPVLESEGLRVGIVTGITGIARYRIELRGRADHAGTMPMVGRRDALTAAAEIALALEALWQDGRGVGTTGRLSVAPNATNVVPGQVELWCEMRSVDGAILESRRWAFVEQAEEIAARRGIGGQIDPVSYEEPVPISEEIQDGFEQVVRALGLPVRRLPSYAGHDGNQMAKIAPIGMLFVPSRAGRSHCPEEWTDLADVALGAQALGEALLQFDARPPAARALAP